MTGTVRRWVAGIVATLILLLAAAASWLVSTESGARWIVARASPYLPDALTLGSVKGTVTSGLQVSSLRWRDEAADVQVDSTILAVQLLPLLGGELTVSSLAARGVDVQVFKSDSPQTNSEPLRIDLPLDVIIDSAALQDIRVRAQGIDRRIDSLRLSASLAGSALSVDAVELRSAWLRLDAATEAMLAPPYASRLSAGWELPGLAGAPLAGQLEITGDMRAWQVSHRLADPAVVETGATVSFPGGEPFVDALSEWSAWDIPLEDGRRIQTRAGRLSLRGGTEEFAFSGAVNATLPGWPAIDIDTGGTATRLGIAIENLVLQSSAGRLQLAGDLGWEDGFGWDLNFFVEEFSPDVVTAALTGAVDASGQTKGRRSVDGSIDADLQIERLGGVLNEYPVTGSITVGLADGLISVPTGEVAVQENKLVFGGTLDTSSGQAFDASLEWSAPQLAVLRDAAGGSSAGRLRVSGTPGKWIVDTRAAASDLSWGDLRVGGAELSGAFGSDLAGRLIVDAADLRIGERDIVSINAVLEGSPAGHTLASRLEAFGTVVDARFTGALDDGAWRGSVDTLQADGDLLGRWTGDTAATLLVSSDIVRLDRLCLLDAASEGSACIALSSGSDTGLEIDAALAGVPLAALPHGLPLAIEVTGHLQADAQLTRQERLWNGAVTAGLVGASLSTTYEGDSVSAAASEAAFRASITDNRLRTSLDLRLDDDLGRLDLDLELADVTSDDSPFESEARVAVNDLSFAPLLVTAVTEVDGRLNGSLRAGGRVSAPDYQGNLRLQDGAFAVPAAGIRVTDVTLALSQSSGGRLQLDGEAMSGDGRVYVKGYTELSDGQDLRAEVSIDGENFEIARLPNWQASASPSVRVTVDPELTEVTGGIVIPRANLVFKDLPESANQPSGDAVVHGRDDAAAGNGRRRSFDLQATLGDDVKLAGFGLTTGVSGSVRLRGGTRMPITGLGRLDLYDGRYKAYGQELEIESGSLIFNGPLENPVLDVQAERRINSDIVAGITLAGTPRAPQSALYSEPAMSDAEVLSYLITGRPLNSASEGEGALLGQAAFALGLSGAGAIATQVGNTLGLDTLAVDGNADTGRIVAGKRLGSRLLVEYGYGLVDKLGTLLLRYELNDRVIIESSTGTASALDVVYSIKKQ